MVDDEPLDLALVYADDALLDEVGCTVEPDRDLIADDPLAARLLSIRQDVESEPIGGLVSLDVAIAAMLASLQPGACA